MIILIQIHHHSQQYFDDELISEHNVLIIFQIFIYMNNPKNLDAQPMTKTLTFNKYKVNFFFQQAFMEEEDLSLFK